MKKKWLSIHVRGFFNSAKGILSNSVHNNCFPCNYFHSPFFITLKGVGWAFQCANKLLEDGVIDYIAFFTESEKTVSMARALISSGYKDKLIVPGKSYVNDTENHIDSMDMRDPGEMETAVSEWLCKINVY